MKYCVFIWPSPFCHDVFLDVAKVFRDTLMEQGHECVISDKFQPDTIHLILGANNIIRKPLPVPEDSIIVNLEQLSPGSCWVNETYLNLLKNHQVWDYARTNIEFLAPRGITDIRKIEIGYGKSLEYKPKNVKQDIDVLFIGSINDRRLEIRTKLLEKYPNTVFIFNVFEDTKRDLIQRAKIVLNIHFYPAKILETIRLSHLLANKKCVVSENSSEPEVDQKWNNGVVICSYQKIVEQVDFLLQHEEIRKQQEQKAYEFIIANPQKLPILKNID